VAAVADRADVSVDTIYASVGRKPQLMLAVIDVVLGEGNDPVPAEQRDYVRAIRAAESAADKIHVYAAALGRVLTATADLQEALRHAAQTDADAPRSGAVSHSVGRPTCCSLLRISVGRARCAMT